MTRTRLLALVLCGLAACRAGASAPAEKPDVAPLPSAGCRPGPVAAEEGTRRRAVVDGLERSFLVDASAGEGDVPRPLVLVFHGFRHDAVGLREHSGFAELAAAGALVAVHPEGRPDVRLLERIGRGWDTQPGEPRDLAFVRALLDDVERAHCIDRRRIFATGFSNGGFVSNLLACTLADRLAAAAAVGGARALDECRPAAPMPILFIHGTADRIVPLGLSKAARAWWRRANRCEGADTQVDGCAAATGCAADVVLCEGPQGHTWVPGTTERVWRFFTTHPRW